MENCVLRKLEPSDLPYLYQWENDAATWADSSTHNPLSQKDLRDYITSSTGDIYRDGQLRLIIMADGATVGCADLFDLDARNRRAAIGLYIAPQARQHGVGMQALHLLEDYAFGFLHLRLLYAIIRISNIPCCQLFTTAHYTPTATLPNWTLEGDAVVFIKKYENRI